MDTTQQKCNCLAIDYSLYTKAALRENANLIQQAKNRMDASPFAEEIRPGDMYKKWQEMIALADYVETLPDFDELPDGDRADLVFKFFEDYEAKTA